MKPPPLTPNQIRELGSPCYGARARAEWLDRNQHVNMRHYVAIFDDAGDAFYPAVGLGGPGTMDVEHHTRFLRELRVDDEIVVYMRIVGVSAKRFHYLMFLIDESTSVIVSRRSGWSA